MRVCIAYAGSLVPQKGGGIASVICNIVKHTSKKIEYVLLAPYDETALSEIAKTYPTTVEIAYVKPQSTVFAGFMNYLVKNVDDFDILHFHNLPFGRDLPLAFKNHFKRKYSIYSHHISYEELCNSKLFLGYYYSIFNLFGRIWKKVVANSQFVMNNDLARFRSLQHKVCLIRNGVDLELVRRAKPIGLNGDPSVLFVGHLVRRKGIDLILEAMDMLSSSGIKANPMLHVVGTGIMEKNCKEYVASHGLSSKVSFWGSVPESSKFGMMKGADIVVVPSRYENFCIVVLEAMAAGKPVIASCVGGIPEVLVQGVNGILTSPCSSNFAMALKYLCERKQLLEEYGRNNQRTVIPFDWKNIAQSYVKLYNMGTSSSDVRCHPTEAV
jgi:glycosyltransferase involved in cell wall biosynthesis